MGTTVIHTNYTRTFMKSKGKSPSEKAVSAVVLFLAGTHLYGKPRPSMLSLMLESFRVRRQVKELTKKYCLDSKGSKWTC
jgi:ribonucleotide monophosphatase NagD (HAD superfamily)